MEIADIRFSNDAVSCAINFEEDQLYYFNEPPSPKILSFSRPQLASSRCISLAS